MTKKFRFLTLVNLIEIALKSFRLVLGLGNPLQFGLGTG